MSSTGRSMYFDNNLLSNSGRPIEATDQQRARYVNNNAYCPSQQELQGLRDQLQNLSHELRTSMLLNHADVRTANDIRATNSNRFDSSWMNNAMNPLGSIYSGQQSILLQRASLSNPLSMESRRTIGFNPLLSDSTEYDANLNRTLNHTINNDTLSEISEEILKQKLKHLNRTQMMNLMMMQRQQDQLDQQSAELYQQLAQQQKLRTNNDAINGVNEDNLTNSRMVWSGSDGTEYKASRMNHLNTVQRSIDPSLEQKKSSSIPSYQFYPPNNIAAPALRFRQDELLSSRGLNVREVVPMRDRPRTDEGTELRNENKFLISTNDIKLQDSRSIPIPVVTALNNADGSALIYFPPARSNFARILNQNLLMQPGKTNVEQNDELAVKNENASSMQLRHDQTSASLHRIPTIVNNRAFKGNGLLDEMSLSDPVPLTPDSLFSGKIPQQGLDKVIERSSVKNKIGDHLAALMEQRQDRNLVSEYLRKEREDSNLHSLIALRKKDLRDIDSRVKPSGALARSDSPIYSNRKSSVATRESICSIEGPRTSNIDLICDKISKSKDEYEAALMLQCLHGGSPNPEKKEDCADIVNPKVDPKRGILESTLSKRHDENFGKTDDGKQTDVVKRKRGRPPKTEQDPWTKIQLDASNLSHLPDLTNQMPPWDKLVPEDSVFCRMEDRDQHYIADSESNEGNQQGMVAKREQAEERKSLLAKARAIVDPSFDGLFVAMAQMTSCEINAEDQNCGIMSYRNLPPGFKGLACRHCSGRPGSGRYFPSTIRCLSQTTTAQNMIKHYINASVIVPDDADDIEGDKGSDASKNAKSGKSYCTSCPYSVWLWLTEFQRRLIESKDIARNATDEDEVNQTKQRVKYGTRKVFYSKVWSRINRNGSEYNRDSDDDGGIIEKTSEVENQERIGTSKLMDNQKKSGSDSVLSGDDDTSMHEFGNPRKKPRQSTPCVQLARSGLNNLVGSNLSTFDLSSGRRIETPNLSDRGENKELAAV